MHTLVNVGCDRDVFIMINPDDNNYVVLRRVYTELEKQKFPAYKTKAYMQLTIGETEARYIYDNHQRLIKLCNNTDSGIPTAINESLGESSIRLVKEHDDNYINIRRYWRDFRDGDKLKPSGSGITINIHEFRGMLGAWQSISKHIKVVNDDDDNEGQGTSACNVGKEGAAATVDGKASDTCEVGETVSIHSDCSESDQEVDDILSKLKRTGKKRKIVTSDDDDDCDNVWLRKHKTPQQVKGRKSKSAVRPKSLEASPQSTQGYHVSPFVLSTGRNTPFPHSHR
jgi:hypothetical protein